MIYFIIAIFLMFSALFYKQKVIWIIAGCLLFASYFQMGALILESPFWVYEPNYIFLYLTFILGLLLLYAEIYVPAFGLVGLTGWALSSYSLYLYEGGLTWVFIYWIIALITMALTYVFHTKLGRTIEISPQFILTKQNHHSSINQSSIYFPQPGESGVVAMDLRPVGRCQFGDHEYQSISHGPFIPKGTKVEVLTIKNGNIYVKEDLTNE